MIPYIKVPDLHVGPLTLHPFGVLVATGVLIGTSLATRRARRRGFDLDKLNSFITSMLVCGFIGGHVLDSLFYHPDEVARRPWSLLMLWEGLSSFGGFVGGLLGVLLWKYVEWKAMFTWKVRAAEVLRFYRPTLRREALPILPFCDLILSVFPVAWVFGRSGCSSVHDHPGAIADRSPFAVLYPSPRANVTDGPGLHTHFGPITFIHGHFPRYDLGLLELLFTCVVALCFAVTWRRKLVTGAYVVAVALSYGPVRFAMDFLRIRDEDGADPRYSGLTPAQWCCVVLTAFGLFLLGYIFVQKGRGIDPAERLKAVEPTQA